MFVSNKKAFTLAEVLITLGIIGVVAAMTIPNLIANVNGQRYRSQFKKTISTLNQAARLSDSQFGFDFAGTNTACNTNVNTASKEHPESVMSFCSLFNGTLTAKTYFGKHTNIPIKESVLNIESGTNTYQIVGPMVDWLFGTGASKFVAYQLADGTIVGFNEKAMNCDVPVGTVLTDTYIKSKLASCIGWVDVNGTSLPNKEVTCSSGQNKYESDSCVVSNNVKNMTDVFPVIFHNQTVEPASAAARYVLKTAK